MRLKPLQDAVAEFDSTAPERAQAWTSAASNQDIENAQKADREALERVQEAFYEVTSDRNSRENCSRVDIEFARKIAARNFL